MEHIEKKLLVLSRIAQALNRQKATWAVGASLLLYCKGMVSEFHDIDIMVAEEDVEKARNALLSLGRQLPANPKAQYKTKCFLEFNVEGVEVDMMAGFTIVREGVDYYFPLRPGDIHDYVEINGETIPLQSLEQWRKYYGLMGRTDKVEIIEKLLP